MNFWLVAATILLAGTVPCLIVLAMDEVMERLVALQGSQVLVTLILLLLAPGYTREIYLDVSLTLAVLSLASGLVFVRFLERWL